MSDQLLDSFINKKKAESDYLSLEDGETVVVKRLVSIKPMTKIGYSGKEQEILRFVLEVETSEGLREKNFDNGTQRFALEVKEKGVQIGCGFTVTRTGEQTKTRYTISNVVPATAPNA